MKETTQIFYPTKDFKYTKLLEDNVDLILDELNELILMRNQNDNHWFAAHPSYVDGKHNVAWKTFEFVFFGIQKKSNIALCPRTYEIISQIPELVTAQFSLLEPNTRIKPHRGYSRIVLRNHLPLIVPKGDCGIKIEDKTHRWKKGKLVIFDDSLIHEAWNNTNELRAVLMFDVAKPNCGYSANEICKYKIERIDDPFLLNLADKDMWMKWYKQGFFD